MITLADALKLPPLQRYPLLCGLACMLESEDILAALTDCEQQMIAADIYAPMVTRETLADWLHVTETDFGNIPC